MRFSYSKMDEIVAYYISRLLENSMLDNSLAIYLYNNYLLNDDVYINYLSKKFKYLIIDSLENSSNAEVDFINLLSNYTMDTYIYFNEKRDYSVFNNIDIEYIYENIIDKIKDNNEDVSRNNTELSDIYLLNSKVILNDSSQLYNEMIGEVCNKVIELVAKGVKLNEIAIISPVNNTILDYQIKSILNDNKISVFNTKKHNKIVDYPYSNALVVAACIFYDCEGYIKEDEYISFIEILFDVNRIKAYKIYRNKEENIEYKALKEYILSKKSENLKTSEFLIKFYIDKILNLKGGIDNVDTCKNIIYESEAFIENIKVLGLNKENNEGKIFIEVLKSTINDYYRVSDIIDLKNSDNIIITTPYSYLSYCIDRPIQIWVDIGSNAWNMKIEKDISNFIVLRKSFKENQIYTNDMEEYYKKYYLYNMIYNLLLDAKEVYAYKSEYSVNGYIQESILYSVLLKLVSKGEM